jgi:hypothetical protein
VDQMAGAALISDHDPAALGLDVTLNGCFRAAVPTTLTQTNEWGRHLRRAGAVASASDLVDLGDNVIVVEDREVFCFDRRQSVTLPEQLLDLLHKP